MSFGPIRQMGYVVDDIDAAMRHWIDDLGVGPFYYIEEQPFVNFRYKGAPSSPVISVALAHSGGVQVELIQQRNDEPSAFREFLDSGEEGLQHVAFWTTSFDEHVREAGRRHMVALQDGWSGSGRPDERFAYFTHRGHRGTVVELSEISGRKGALFAAVEDAAQRWDGTDPIRDMRPLVSA